MLIYHFDNKRERENHFLDHVHMHALCYCWLMVVLRIELARIAHVHCKLYEELGQVVDLSNDELYVICAD